MQQMQHVAGKDTERSTKANAKAKTTSGICTSCHISCLSPFVPCPVPLSSLRVLVNLLRANVNSGTCSQVRLATGCPAPVPWSCHYCESCPKMNECSPRPVGNKNVVVAKQRRGYSPCHLSLYSCLLCHCCTQLRLVCNALSIDKVSTRYRYLANSYDDDDAVQTQHNVQYLDYLFAAAEVSFCLFMYVSVCVFIGVCVCVLVCCGHVCGLVSLSASLHSLFSGFVLAEQSNLTAECKLRITKLRRALQDALLIPLLLFSLLFSFWVAISVVSALGSAKHLISLNESEPD